MKIIVTVIWCF